MVWHLCGCGWVFGHVGRQLCLCLTRAPVALLMDTPALEAEGSCSDGRSSPARAPGCVGLLMPTDAHLQPWHCIGVEAANAETNFRASFPRGLSRSSCTRETSSAVSPNGLGHTVPIGIHEPTKDQLGIPECGQGEIGSTKEIMGPPLCHTYLPSQLPQHHYPHAMSPARQSGVPQAGHQPPLPRGWGSKMQPLVA